LHRPGGRPRSAETATVKPRATPIRTALGQHTTATTPRRSPGRRQQTASRRDVPPSCAPRPHSPPPPLVPKLRLGTQPASSALPHGKQRFPHRIPGRSPGTRADAHHPHAHTSPHHSFPSSAWERGPQSSALLHGKQRFPHRIPGRSPGTRTTARVKTHHTRSTSITPSRPA
jgi:hypothetical protein